MQADSIVRLGSGDLRQLQDLLRLANLPGSDCRESISEFFGIFESGRLIAAGGLEAAADQALLRSVVVRDDYRGLRLAQRITEFLIARARSEGKTALYLLTEGAADYFRRFGFVPIERDAVPPCIAATRQFSDLCPQSADCLRLELRLPGQ